MGVVGDDEDAVCWEVFSDFLDVLGWDVGEGFVMFYAWLCEVFLPGDEGYEFFDGVVVEWVVFGGYCEFFYVSDGVVECVDGDVVLFWVGGAEGFVGGDGGFWFGFLGDFGYE